MAKISRTKADNDAVEFDHPNLMQITFEIGGEFASAESAREYADKLMDCPEFAAFCRLIDADLFCFIRNNSTGDFVLRNCNGSEDWDSLPPID